MKTFLVHIALTLAIVLVVKEYLPINASGIIQFAGVITILLSLWLTSYFYNRSYFLRFFSALSLFFYFLKELAISNFKVIYFIITPGLQFRPAIIKFPLTLQSEKGIVLLANLITLTPGTLTLKVSEDKRFLYYHSINVPGNNLDEAKRRIKEGFEKHIIAIIQ